LRDLQQIHDHRSELTDFDGQQIHTRPASGPKVPSAMTQHLDRAQCRNERGSKLIPISAHS
jgi:hypothetical protein